MPFIKTRRNGNSGSLVGEKVLIIVPITVNGDTGKRLPANCLIKNIIVKATLDVPSFRFGTTNNADDLCYETTLPAFKPQSFAPFAITNAITNLFVSGINGTNAVVSIIILYQPFNL